MADPVHSSAARTAALVAIPVALAIGVLSLWQFGAFDGPASAPTTAPVVQPSAPVSVPAPALPQSAAGVCRAVIAHLPDAVRQRTRRPVAAGPEQNAAYGDPPITLACGATAPTYPPTQELFPLSGVCFVAMPAGTGGTVWTTVDRAVPVAVSVPGPQEGSAQSVIPFSAAIAANDPGLPPTAVPSGCTG